LARPDSGSGSQLCEAETGDLKRWLIDEHKSTLYDISAWNENGSWKEWNLGGVPDHLNNQAQILFSSLKGEAPILRVTPDSRGWGTNGYSVKDGYNTLLSTLRVYQNSTKWKNIWSQDSLPKINFFIWSLSHGKILTGENLMKRGFHGPFIYPLVPKQSRQHSSPLLELPFFANSLECGLWRSVQKNKMALCSKS
jgi:hypothetical protein